MHMVYTHFHEPLKKIKSDISNNDWFRAEKALNQHILYSEEDVAEEHKCFVRLFNHISLYTKHLEEARDACLKKQDKQRAEIQVGNAMEEHQHIVDQLNQIIEIGEKIKKDEK